MEKQRKKELLEMFKQMKPEMGILQLTCKANGNTYLVSTRNTKATINGLTFQLNNKSYPCKSIQRDWSEFGSGQFTISVIETLPYDETGNRTNYSEDLKLLLEICHEKLKKAEIIREQ